MRLEFWNWLTEFRKLLEVPPPDPRRHAANVLKILRVLLQPGKLLIVAPLLYQLFVVGWSPAITTVRPDLLVLFKSALAGYGGLNLAVYLVLILNRNFPLEKVTWLAFGLGLADTLFLALVALVTGGFESLLSIWPFLGLIIVNSLTFPLSALQLVLNLILSTLYLGVGIGAADIMMNNTSAASEQTLGLQRVDTILLRVLVLLLLTACCYGAQVLAARQRQVEEEAREFAARQGQLRTAGRLAAEIAHQVKNPLAIINNATFSLRRALANGKTDVAQQLNIIQEEIERSDRIITQLMGYARLAEGRVEKISITEEMEKALDEVLPQAIGYEVHIDRDYASNLPTLVMQRGHINTVLVNLLQNAREAIEGRGRVQVAIRLTSDNSVEVSIQDDGPGIPAEQSERIFEAYFTTKEKGTGLGLAIVKHNVDLYGGTIRVESALGKGARFVLVFPARALSQADKSV